MNAPTVKLPSGYDIPVIGFGTFETPPDVCEKVVAQALKDGYRQIDSAAYYGNEAECGAAIRSSGIPRSEIFYVTKLNSSDIGYGKTEAGIQNSLNVAGLAYIDLYLIHAPFGDTKARNGSWQAMVEAVRKGQVRSIGVCNYGIHHLKELEEYRSSDPGLEEVPISVGQYELHPWMPRKEIVAYARKHDMIIQAFGPLALAKHPNNPKLVVLAEKYGKSWSQILIRWSLQQGFIPLPKSVTEERILENANVFDFTLDPADVEALTTDEYQLNRGEWDPVSWGLSGPPW